MIRRPSFVTADARIDDELGKIGLVIAEPHDQERLAGKFPLQPGDEILVVALGHRLPPQIFVDLGHRIAGIAPACGVSSGRNGNS